MPFYIEDKRLRKSYNLAMNKYNCIRECWSLKDGQFMHLTCNPLTKKQILISFTFYFIYSQLLDFEARAAEQVPLLMKMKRDQLALTKAIDSGDTDLGELLS